MEFELIYRSIHGRSGYAPSVRSWLGLFPVDRCIKRENEAADGYPSLIPISFMEKFG
jgi:hypothetical protein